MLCHETAKSGLVGRNWPDSLRLSSVNTISPGLIPTCILNVTQVGRAFYGSRDEHRSLLWPRRRHRIPLRLALGGKHPVFALKAASSHPFQYWLGPFLGSLLASAFYAFLKQYVRTPSRPFHSH